MKKLLILFISLLVFATASNAQQKKSDLVQQYKDDTTGFTRYIQVNIFENLKLRDKYAIVEINTWVTPYVRGQRDFHIFKNLYRYPAPAQQQPDTLVLTKCDLRHCFTA